MENNDVVLHCLRNVALLLCDVENIKLRDKIQAECNAIWVAVTKEER